MPNLKTGRVKLPTYFHKLHAKYDSGEALAPPWLRVFPNEVREEIIQLRKEAFYYFIERAALRVRTRHSQANRRKELQALGGQWARLKGMPGREEESQEIEGRIKSLRRACRIARPINEDPTMG